MAPRSSWKGFLKLSLVSVPVKAYTAHASGEEIRLNQLHAECHKRVRYLKVCPEHGELKSDQIISGYEYGKDQYVVIDPEEIQKIRPQSDRSISIAGFVKPDAIDPLYYSGKTYYLAPDGVAGNKPYALLHRGMQENDVCALAQIVLSGRESLVVVRPVDRVLAMEFLHYARSVRTVHEYRDLIEEQTSSKEELALANTLIAASTIEDLDLAAYEDPYVAELKQLIEAKVQGKEIVQVEAHEEPRILNLMDALKKSVAEAQAAAATGRPAAPKMAPSEAAGAAKKKPARKRKSG